MGDSIYQMLCMKELEESLKTQTDFINIQINKKANFSQAHPYGDKQLTKDAAEFMLPLIKHVFPKASLKISEDVPQGCIDLDAFRQRQLNFASGDIRTWCYSLVSNQLPMNLRREVITGIQPTPNIKDRILITRSSRYNNVFLHWDILKPLQDKLLFMGMKAEHEAFEKQFFNVEFCPVKDAMEAASMIKGARYYIANQTGLYSIAEMMKSPRALTTAEYIDIFHPHYGKQMIVPGPCNVVPQRRRLLPYPNRWKDASISGETEMNKRTMILDNMQELKGTSFLKQKKNKPTEDEQKIIEKTMEKYK